MEVLERDRINQQRTSIDHYTDVIKRQYSYFLEKPEPIKFTSDEVFYQIQTLNKNFIIAVSNMQATLHEPVFSSAIQICGKELLDINIPDNNIEAAISEAKFVTELPENWDEDGAVKVNKEIFEAAASFLIQYNRFLSSRNVHIQAPEINPVRNGSIDLEWHTPKAQMLVNIRKKEEGYFAYYYGDFYNDKKPVKGNVPLNEFSEHLAVWMKNLA